MKLVTIAKSNINPREHLDIKSAGKEYNGKIEFFNYKNHSKTLILRYYKSITLYSANGKILREYVK